MAKSPLGGLAGNPKVPLESSSVLFLLQMQHAFTFLPLMGTH